ncbi:alkyl sulfatase C-terminal domain-containing protein [Undibacterium sp. TC9W]|uniref:alkyl sulfatase C-terminal domain-containing protein n=1 Tax=Undibacterium sp. TC9W TaxID=3413053 RepID=UPI003BF1D459
MESFLEAIAAGLNGPDAEGKDFKFNLVLTDTKESYVLWIENAVLHHKKAEPVTLHNRTHDIYQNTTVTSKTSIPYFLPSSTSYHQRHDTYLQSLSSN